MEHEKANVFWENVSRITALYEQTAAETGLTEWQLRVLDAVERLPGCTQKALCGHLNLSKQRVSLLVRQLMEKNILELAPDAADSRLKHVRFTPQGRETVDSFLPALTGRIDSILGAEQMHVHVQPDGSVIAHTHAHEASHTHTHAHENTKVVLDRLARSIGHLGKVRSMVENGADCSEVLIQLAAVKSAINNAGKLILKDHIGHCLVDAVEHGDMEAVEELKQAIDQFIK